MKIGIISDSLRLSFADSVKKAAVAGAVALWGAPEGTSLRYFGPLLARICPMIRALVRRTSPSWCIRSSYSRLRVRRLLAPVI